jgi:LacI family transcriptional regulator
MFLVKSKSNMFFADLLVRLQSHAGYYGYNGVVNYLDENENEVELAGRLVHEFKPKGIVFLGGNDENFNSCSEPIGIPAVIATNTSSGMINETISQVGIDDEQSGYMAVKYLIDRGHRKIAILGGNTKSSMSYLRKKGAYRCMQEHGISINEALYGYTNYEFETAHQAMCHLLESEETFTAVFAMSDTVAMAAMRAIVSAGKRVPEDISVIGFDGIPLTQYMIPVLTTVRQPADEIAKKSIELLAKKIEQDAPPQKVIVEADILKGESVKRI